MKKSSIIALTILLASVSAEATDRKPYEMPGTQVVPVQDVRSGRQYELYIKLPERYSEDKDAKYPVIYFTDAIWHIEILSASTQFLMDEVILVGISWQTDIEDDLRKDLGAHASRFRDYSIRKSGNPEIQAKYGLGQASHHLGFIRNDVIKYVESNFRTDPGGRTYFGYSLGGEFGAYILLAQPDTFRNYILGSPSVDGDIPYLSELGSNAELKRKGLNANVFISHGSLEKELGEHVEKLVGVLKNVDDKSLSMKHVVIEGDHQAAFPMTGVRSVTWLSGLESGG